MIIRLEKLCQMGIKGLGSTITYYRLKRGLTKSQLARLVRCHPSQITRIENNERAITESFISQFSIILLVKIESK